MANVTKLAGQLVFSPEEDAAELDRRIADAEKSTAGSAIPGTVIDLFDWLRRKLAASVRKKVYNLWLIVYRAPDVPGEWIAHCLDLDVVTQGSSLAHAIEMAREAVGLAIDDDLEAGRDPLDRRAPDQDFADLYGALSHSHPIDLTTMPTLALSPEDRFIGQLVARASASQPGDGDPRDGLVWAALSKDQAA